MPVFPSPKKKKEKTKQEREKWRKKEDISNFMEDRNVI